MVYETRVIYERLDRNYCYDHKFIYHDNLINTKITRLNQDSNKNYLVWLIMKK